MKITYSNEALDAYSNQINCEAGIYVDGEIVGVVQYVLYNDELSISNIFIRPEFRRKGFGSRLIRYIKQENPNYEYKSSLKTDLGAKFVHKEIGLYETKEKKIVKEYINEKFEIETDPVSDMGIGLYVKRNFNSSEDYAKFMIKNLPAILGEKEIPNDYLQDKGYYFNRKYNKVDEYTNRYITIKDREIWNHDNLILYKMLLERGFKK